MNIGRFLVQVESKKEKRFFRKKKGRKKRFLRYQLKGFLSMKDLLKKKEKHLSISSLVEGVGYGSSKTKYFISLGFKRNFVINEERISIYNRFEKGWLNLRFNFQKSSIGYLFRNRWYLGNKRTRKSLEKRRRYMKWIYRMHYRVRNKEKDFLLRSILKKGVPIQIGLLQGRTPYSREVLFSSVLYFLRERFLNQPPYDMRLKPRIIKEEREKEREEEWESHQIRYVPSKYRLKNRIKWMRRKLRRKKKSSILWMRPFGLLTFRKDGRCHN